MAKFSKFLPSWKLVALSLPIVAIPTTVGAVYLAPVKAEIFHPQSSLELGYQNEYFRPPQVNKYHAPVQPANSHLNVLNQPNYKAAQSYDLLSGDYNTLHKPDSQTTLNAGDSTQHLVYKMDFNRQQFISVFKTRYLPQLAFNFGFKVNEVGKDQKTIHTQTFPNLFTSFTLSELNYLKSQTYTVFDYNLNDDFADYNGTVSLNMAVNMGKNDNFSVSFYLSSTGLTSDNGSSLNVSLLNPQETIKPVVFWNENATNNYQNWFWPLPIGPKQPADVQAPAVDSKVVNKNLYTTQKQSSTQNGEFQFTNKELTQTQFNASNGFASDATTSPAAADPQPSTSSRASATTTAAAAPASTKPTSANTASPTVDSNTTNPTQNLYTFTFDRNNWQQAFYNMWGEDIPLNPGVKFGFNLNFSLLDAKYNQTQNYAVPIYSYFNVNEITHGNSYTQKFLDYDLGAGREANAGHFQLFLKTHTSLNGKITVTVQAVNDDLRMVTNTPDKNANNNQAKFINFDLTDPVVTVYKNNKGVATDQNKLLPNNNFVIDVSNQNIQAVNSHIDFKAGTNYGTLKPRSTVSKTWRKYLKNKKWVESWSTDWSDPYLFTAKTISTGEESLNLGNYVENNNQYAHNSYLRFNFTGTNETNNQADILPNSGDGNLQQSVYFNPGFDENGKEISQYNTPHVLKNRAVDNYNYFSIPVDKITTNPTSFEWKKMWVYIAQSRDDKNVHAKDWISQLDKNVIGWNGGKRDFSYYIPSFMKAWFDVVIWVKNDPHTQKPDYTKIYYKLETNAISYSWYWETSTWKGVDQYYFNAATGKAGFKLNSFKLTVNVDDSSSTPATTTATPVVKSSK